MHTLDEFDLKILSILAEDGRVSWTDLADRVGRSVTPTIRRVRALEESGYILGYNARLDETAVGRGLTVFVSVSLDQQNEEALHQFEEEIAGAPEVMSCFMMTGPADFLLQVQVRDLAAYQAFLMRSVTCIKGVSRISSSFALKLTLKRPAPLPL